VLVQELPAVEGLARVDVVCLDETGTLTYGDVRFDRLERLDGDDRPAPGAEVRDALGMLAAADPSNATAAALGVAYPAPGEAPMDTVPFSSARKWSAVRTAAGTTWVLGRRWCSPHRAPAHPRPPVPGPTHWPWRVAGSFCWPARSRRRPWRTARHDCRRISSP